jgi:hypothetical protein
LLLILELIRKNATVIQKQIINYIEFLDSLIRSKEILKKEKVWNIFKNYDTRGIGFLTTDQTHKAFCEILGKKVKFIEISLIKKG